MSFRIQDFSHFLIFWPIQAASSLSFPATQLTACYLPIYLYLLLTHLIAVSKPDSKKTSFPSRFSLEIKLAPRLTAPLSACLEKRRCMLVHKRTRKPSLRGREAKRTKKTGHLAQWGSQPWTSVGELLNVRSQVMSR